MEDRFKFRVWDKENKKYFEPIYDARVKKIEELLLLPTGCFMLRTFNGLRHESTFEDMFIKEFCTGIKDKEGELIFEGDIFKYQHRALPNKYYIGIVKFGKYKSQESIHFGFFIEWQNLSEGEQIRSDLIFWIEDRFLSSIGSKFENPELLEGGG